MSANPEIPEELHEKLVGYLEWEAGRDVPPSPEDEKLVRELLSKNPAARTLAEDLREVDRGLVAMFDALGRIPVSDELMRRIRAQQEAFELGGIDAFADRRD